MLNARCTEVLTVTTNEKWSLFLSVKIHEYINKMVMSCHCAILVENSFFTKEVLLHTKFSKFVSQWWILSSLTQFIKSICAFFPSSRLVVCKLILISLSRTCIYTKWTSRRRKIPLKFNFVEQACPRTLLLRCALFHFLSFFSAIS